MKAGLKNLVSEEAEARSIRERLYKKHGFGTINETCPKDCRDAVLYTDRSRSRKNIIMEYIRK